MPAITDQSGEDLDSELGSGILEESGSVYGQSVVSGYEITNVKLSGG